MPVEIRELVVKTTIDNSGNGGLNLNDKQMKRLIGQMKEDILNECLMKMQEQLERNNER